LAFMVNLGFKLSLLISASIFQIVQLSSHSNFNFKNQFNFSPVTFQKHPMISARFST